MADHPAPDMDDQPSAKRQKTSNEEAVQRPPGMSHVSGRRVPVNNPALHDGVDDSVDADALYHFGLDSSMPLRAMFSDVKFVLMGGSAKRAEKVARQAVEVLGIDLPTGVDVVPVGKTERFSLFKVGPLLSVSHGMGMPSMSICLHELTKILYYARATDVIYVRIGTSGGVGVEPGTVIVATGAVDGELKPSHRLIRCGEEIRHPSSLDNDLSNEIFQCRGDVPATQGITMGTDCFYEGQARLDGAIAEHDMADKNAFLQRCHEAGVRNIEMESSYFAAFTHRLGIPAALCCVALVNRLNGDQIHSTPDELVAMSTNAQTLVFNWVKARLAAMKAATLLKRKIRAHIAAKSKARRAARVATAATTATAATATAATAEN